MPSISVTRESNTRIKADISVNADEIKPAEEAALKKVTAKADIKGFRKGKAPAHLVRQKYAADLNIEKLFALVDTHLDDVQKKVEERIYRLVRITDVDEKGDKMLFSVLLDLYPYVKIGKLKGIQLTQHIPEITETDIDAEIKNKLLRFATYEEVENTFAEEADLVTVDFEIWVDDAPSGEVNKDFAFRLGSGELSKELEDKIASAKGKVGEEFKLKKEIPQDSNSKNRNYEIIATIKKISKPKLPELTDTFVTENFKELKTVQEFRNKIKDDLTKQFNIAVVRSQTDDALKALQKISEFFLSESFLDSELDNFLADKKVNRSELTEEQIAGIKKFLGEQEHSTLLLRQLLRDAEKSYQKRTKTTDTYMQIFKTYVHNEISRFEKDASRIEQLSQDLDRAIDSLSSGEGTPNNPWESIASTYLMTFNRQFIFDYFAEEGLVKKGKKLTYKELVPLLAPTPNAFDNP